MRAAPGCFQVLDQIFLLQRPLVLLLQCFARAHQEIKQCARDGKEHDEQRREDLGDDAPGPRLDVLERPHDEREPECQIVRTAQGDEKMRCLSDELFPPLCSTLSLQGRRSKRSIGTTKTLAPPTSTSIGCGTKNSPDSTIGNKGLTYWVRV
jgi:hypothetical protein